MSLRRRLVLGLVVIGAVLVVTNVVLAARYQSFLLERIDRQLVDVASRPVFRGDEDRGPGRRPPARSRRCPSTSSPSATRRPASCARSGRAFADDDRAAAAARVAMNIRKRAVEPASRPEPFDAPAADG